MSDPVSNAEIEDVLSSIRRLVSDNPSGRKDTAATAQPDKLVLTPAFRVRGAGEERAAPETAAEEDRPTGSYYEMSLEQRIAELEAALGKSAGDWEPDGSESDDTDETAPLGRVTGTPFEGAFEIDDETAEPEARLPADDETPEPEAPPAAADESAADEMPGLRPDPEARAPAGEEDDGAETDAIADAIGDELSAEATGLGGETAGDAGSEDVAGAGHGADTAPGAAGDDGHADALESQWRAPDPAAAAFAAWPSDPEASEPDLDATEAPDTDLEAPRSWEEIGLTAGEQRPAEASDSLEEIGLAAEGAEAPAEAQDPESAAEASEPEIAALTPETELAGESPEQALASELEGPATAAERPEPEVAAEAPGPETAAGTPEPEIAAEDSQADERHGEPLELRFPPREQDEAPSGAGEAREPDLRAEPERDDRQQREPDGDGFGLAPDKMAALEHEALRDMVSDLVREELQGALGERITRNVRRLVRQEIQKALAVRDLE